MKLKQKNNNNNNNDTHILQCFGDQSSIWNQSKTIERLSNKCPKPKTKVIKTAYQKKGNTLKSQWELEAKTTKLSYARENAGDQFLICFSFASDWLRKWGEFSGPITARSNAIPNQSQIAIENQLKLFYNEEKRNINKRKQSTMKVLRILLTYKGSCYVSSPFVCILRMLNNQIKNLICFGV